ncbi:hypothetical protein Ciccas_014217 [Cichlidogyrus casuarinus]|uniref:Uncharacterized protein n=1 Tax=Cichlidogyrus casuarinus TaxID=1844966 RepID=A0ABD2PKV2_9PLAT
MPRGAPQDGSKSHTTDQVIILDSNEIFSHDRNTQHLLEVDTQDKFAALQIDQTAHMLGKCSNGVTFHTGIEDIDNKYDTRVFPFLLEQRSDLPV